MLRYLESHAPATVRWELIHMAGGPASISDRALPCASRPSPGLETVWGKRPVFKREGGSVPVVAQMQKSWASSWSMTGFGLPDDNMHAPNEKLHLPTWYRGIEALIHFIYNLRRKRENRWHCGVVRINRQY